MLRIPLPGEKLPPLVVPLKAATPEELVLDRDPHKGNQRRRKRKARKGEGHAWDDESGKLAGSEGSEKGQMFWMMIGGAMLFVLIVAGVVAAMLRGSGRVSPQVVLPPPATSAMGEGAAVSHPVPQKTDAAILAEAEPGIRRFLEARRVEDLLPLVRHPDVSEARMRGFYQGGAIEAPGLAEFNTGAELTRLGTISSVKIRTRDYEVRSVAFQETPEGIRIDWESWAGWSEMPWGEFLKVRPSSAKLFRVKLSAVDYFNFAFTDDKKWQSYRLESPDGEHAVFGYAERGSVLASRLHPPPDVKEIAVTLLLKFPGNASANQVIIEKCIADGWVLETEDKP
jgi:hypothetical protein